MKQISPPYQPGARTPTLTLGAALLFAAAIGTSACGSAHSGKPAALGAAPQEHLEVEVPATGSFDRGLTNVEPSRRLPDGLDVWYREEGDSVLLAARSSGVVLMHANVSKKSQPEGMRDKTFAAGPNSRCAQYYRQSGDPADCLEIRSDAEVRSTKTKNRWETYWRIPKVELGWGAGGADVSFEVFDEENQMSTFYPGPPFLSVAHLVAGRTTRGDGAPKVLSRPPDVSPKPSLATSTTLPNPAAVQVDPAPTQEPKPKLQGSGFPSSNYNLTLKSNGVDIERGKHYLKDDQLLANGQDLVAAVQYRGATPNKTTFSLDWYVHGPTDKERKLVSHFPNMLSPADPPKWTPANADGKWLDKFGNKAIEPGENTLELVIDDQTKESFTFYVDEVKTEPKKTEPK